ncbi:MAG TPA: 2-dehydropantoate 2-reductase [Pyrinomonadaceae bacterium]|jgi:2-dehydropantoate 2-reductase
MKPNIYIIGAGAVGKTLAVFLKKAGKNVFLVRGSVHDAPRRREKIQVVMNDESEASAEVETGSLSVFSPLDGVVVLTAKSFGNRNLAQALKGKTDGSPLVVLQNGLGVEQPFIDCGYPEIYRCVLFVTSQLISENKVSFKPVATSPIGVVKGGAANLNEIVEALDNPAFPFKAETDIEAVVWKKAIINSVFNSICPLLEADNGVFHREAEALAIAKRVIAECVAIAREKGIRLETDEVAERLLLISRASDGQLISTLQDILNRRQTEIETLNFAIAGIAEQLNKENSVKETRLLGELTRLKSNLSRRQ